MSQSQTLKDQQSDSSSGDEEFHNLDSAAASLSDQSSSKYTDSPEFHDKLPCMELYH